MMFTGRHSSVKFFATATLISLSILVCFHWFLIRFSGETRYFDHFPDPQCVPGAGHVAGVSIESTKEAAAAIIEHIRLVTPSPVTVTITTTEKTTQAPTATAIPRKLWYKVGPKGLSEDSKGWIDSCLSKNPTYRHELLTDASGDGYVKEHFSERPDIIETYLSLSIPIWKADLLRYLILYAEGGIWSDLDVSCEEGEIHNWVPEQYAADTGLVVGLEFDIAWEDDNFLHSQFASWTIMTKPGSVHMMMVVNDIVESMKAAAEEKNIALSGLTMEMMGDVVDATGPKRMTGSIVKSMELVLGDTVDDRNISKLHEPKLIGDVLILPANAFAAIQSGFPDDQGPTLVTHHYAGTWKNDHGGEVPDIS